MELIITPNKLEKEFKRLITKYRELYFISAWAGNNSEQLKLLIDNKVKIKTIVIGIHFYQTHPEFIELFIDNEQVQFVTQPQGTFHPKLYLFYNTNTEWEIIVGSSNFTKSGFSINTEVNCLINSNEPNSSEILKNAFIVINESWKISKRISITELERYKAVWKNQKPKIKSLSGKYGGNNDNISIHEIPVMNMTWSSFFNKVSKDNIHGIDTRINVIEIAQRLFKSVEHFNELSLSERKFIAGVKTDYHQDWGYFGSMIGRGNYVHEIIENNINISYALDQIPLYGQITKAHYENFIKHFSKVFEGRYIGTASRLLTMKRPDTFYCLTSKNQKLFCNDFKVKKSEIDYEGYWENVIMRIYDSEWWVNPKPISKKEQSVSNARAAFLDAIYYDES